jgi:hypothetical protein
LNFKESWFVAFLTKELGLCATSLGRDATAETVEGIILCCNPGTDINGNTLISGIIRTKYFRFLVICFIINKIVET